MSTSGRLDAMSNHFFFLYKMERFQVDCCFHDDNDIGLISPWTCKPPFFTFTDEKENPLTLLDTQR